MQEAVNFAYTRAVLRGMIYIHIINKWGKCTCMSYMSICFKGSSLFCAHIYIMLCICVLSASTPATSPTFYSGETQLLPHVFRAGELWLGGGWVAFHRALPWTVVPVIGPLEMHMRKGAYGCLQTTLKLLIYLTFTDG